MFTLCSVCVVGIYTVQMDLMSGCAYARGVRVARARTFRFDVAPAKSGIQLTFNRKVLIMTIQEDSNGQSCVSVGCRNGHILLTYVELSSAWEGGISAVRIQTQDENGVLQKGTEIPVDVLPKVAKALLELIGANQESVAISALLSLCSKG